MRNDRTSIVLHLVDVLERQTRHPAGRPHLVRWIEQQLDAGMTAPTLIEQYPKHLHLEQHAQGN